MRRTRSLAAVLLFPTLVAGARAADAQAVKTTARVRLRVGPSTDDSIIKTLAKGANAVLIDPDPGPNGFFHIRVASGQEGWTHGLYLVPAPVDADATSLAEAELSGSYPSCGGAHHYRWAVKVDHAGISSAATAVTIATMLGWDAGDQARNLASWCADRGGKELKLYAVTGWVRRIKKQENDGDWHIEMTATAGAAVAACIIVEIPDPQFGTEYQTARDDLDNLVGASTLAANGDLSPAVRVRFTGAAFYDGWHKTTADHGRCNSTPGARWELHPVTAVAAP